MLKNLNKYFPFWVSRIISDYAQNAILIINNWGTYLFDGKEIIEVDFYISERPNINFFYDLSLDKMSEYVDVDKILELMNHKTHFSSSITFGDSFLYYSGGMRENEIGGSREVYKIDIKKSTLIGLPLMNNTRRHHSSLFWKNKLYVTGGVTSQGISSSMEIFNGERWSNAPKMNKERVSHLSIIYNNELYVFGGTKGIDIVTSVEKYDFSRNEWTIVTQLPESKIVEKVIVMDDSIYVFNDSTIHIYHPLDNKWSNFKHSYEFGRDFVLSTLH